MTSVKAVSMSATVKAPASSWISGICFNTVGTVLSETLTCEKMELANPENSLGVVKRAGV